MDTRYRIKVGAHVLELYNGETVIGREESCGVCLDDDQVSRQHAVIRVQGDNVVLMDLNSRNGTELNGSKLEEPVRLRDGDKITVGRQTLFIQQIRAPQKKKGLKSGTLDGVKSRRDFPTVTALNASDGFSAGMVTAEADLLKKSLQMGRWSEAERLLKARVTRLLKSPEPLPPADPRVRLTVDGLLRLAQHEMNAVWMDRLFKLYGALHWWMDNDTVQKSTRLLRAMGKSTGTGLQEYIVYWQRHKGELSPEDKITLARLEEVAKIVT